MENKKIVLGLDIGVASVGWGIIEKDTGTIIDKGVRLFSEIDPENNEKRRNHRHIRRSLRRKEFRLYRTKRALLEMGLIDSLDFLPLENPYFIRCKGLKEKLSNDELATAILHLMKRNGFRYEVADDDEGGTKVIKEEYLCKHQLKLLQDNGKVRGSANKYHFSLYKKEFLKLLDVQNVGEKYKTRLIELFEKRRHFEEGPGGPNSPTQYGRYLTIGGEPINLIEKMRGHCSIFKDELRAPKVCPSSELFNLLNDLNNITINGNHIGYEKKTFIIESFILDKGKITIKKLEDYLGCTIQRMSGLRVNANGKPIITEVKSIQKVKEACKKNNLPEFLIDGFDDLFLLDDMFEVLTHTKSIEERKELLLKFNNNKITEKYAEAFANIKGVAEYHSLSLKAIRLLNKELLETNKNSQQIIVTLENNNDNTTELKVPNDVIMSPVVVKSVNQTFKIIKAITKRYGHLDTVMIEMAREKNSEDLKKKITEGLKNREQKKNEVLELLQGREVEITRDIIDKVLLYKEQNCKSVYSGRDIDLVKLISSPNEFEIDHIIPYSISLDDSKSNKVLVYSNENQIKGQRTPYQIMSMCPHGFLNFDEFESYVCTNNNFSNKKKENLLNKKDINAGDVREDFINRNLSDTRYISRMVLNILKKYYSQNEIHTKVHVVNGVLTSKLREVCGLKKDRDLYCHHAVDALLIASMLKSTYLESIIQKRLVDSETGEIYTLDNDKEIFGPVADAVAAQIKELDFVNDFKFSYKIDTKPNRSLSDETLYSTTYVDGELRVIKKYKNIYDKDGEKVANIIRQNARDIENLLIYKYDKKTFALLQKIVATYPESKNPFASYLKDHGHIRKYNLGGVSPVVTSLKYIEDKVNTHLDVSNKFKSKPSKIKTIKLQLSSYRMDLYHSPTKGYRFVTIRYVDVKNKKGQYYIDPIVYEELKRNACIDETFSFVNTYYRGDLMERVTDEKAILDVYKAVNNAQKMIIETSYFGTETKKANKDGEYKKFQNMVTIGKKINSINKYSTDILGNRYRVKDERLKLKWK